ncbi:hypothetical protein [Mycobacteroides salmoniphilum]|uniref:Transmembrane protein n=1 Tax=Mycobacteroides salmoniphilum TaxID=404941 RepID=A0A4R8SLM8_9MYCO|nr:hypothetical protein [Mycobacteroides salmoniphilum]TDZ98565.1 hypothetical protein CCUG60885_00435 [Mycobacteroides salmoniphilum]TEA03095.1 hypothetical protein CCUG60883_03719 [Mycobacteroides salmoniphilum]
MTKRQIGFVAVPLLSLLAFIAWWTVLGKMLVDCEIGSRVSSGTTIVFAAPAVLVGMTMAIWATYALAARVPRNWSQYSAIGAAIIMAAIAVVVAVALTFSPGSYDISQTCPSGAPVWWPFPG